MVVCVLFQARAHAQSQHWALQQKSRGVEETLAIPVPHIMSRIPQCKATPPPLKMTWFNVHWVLEHLSEHNPFSPIGKAIFECLSKPMQWAAPSFHLLAKRHPVCFSTQKGFTRQLTSTRVNKAIQDGAVANRGNPCSEIENHWNRTAFTDCFKPILNLYSQKSFKVLWIATKIQGLHSNPNQPFSINAVAMQLRGRGIHIP